MIFPEWLTQYFLQKFLSDGINQPQLKILNHDIKPAVAPGDNYASIILRTKLEVQKTPTSSVEMMSVILKVLPPGENFAKELEKLDLFKVESRMLGEYVPRMQKLLDQVKPGLPKLCATLYNSQGAPNYCIMMEDLCVNGFKLASRFIGADLDHCVLVMKSYARLHACSYALVQKDPSLKETYKNIAFSRNNPELLSSMLSGGFTGFMKQVEKWSEVPKSFVEKVHEISKTVVDKFFDFNEFDENNLNVVLHGDCWLTNMMFQYDDNNKPIHLNFVDLQISAYNDHIFDLMYFLFSSAQLYVKVDHLDALLKIYYNDFIEYNTLLKQNVNLNYEKFEKSFYNKLFMGMVYVCVFVPLMLIPPTDVVPVDEIIGDESWVANNKVFESATLKEQVLALMPLFQKYNIF